MRSRKSFPRLRKEAKAIRAEELIEAAHSRYWAGERSCTTPYCMQAATFPCLWCGQVETCSIHARWDQVPCQWCRFRLWDNRTVPGGKDSPKVRYAGGLWHLFVVILKERPTIMRLSWLTQHGFEPKDDSLTLWTTPLPVIPRKAA